MKINRNSVILHGETSGKVSKTFYRSFSKRCTNLGLPLPVRPYYQNPEYQKEYRKVHRERLNFEAARRKRERRLDNPEYVRERQRIQETKSRKRPEVRLRANLRRRLHKALKGICSSPRTLRLLGCSIDVFREHLENKFVAGMTWENYGSIWHVDHIKPCAKFDLTDPEQQKDCFHWTNQQPLFALDNFRKNAKYATPN